jgi:hypothetical protein
MIVANKRLSSYYLIQNTNQTYYGLKIWIGLDNFNAIF